MDMTTLSASLRQKNNLQFPTKLREQIEREAGLTEEEIEILRLRAKGYSIVKIAQVMSDTRQWYGARTVERRIRRIKDKIIAMLEWQKIDG